MKRIIVTIIITAVVFAAGVQTGRWMNATQPLPPPPISVMGEIRDVPLSAKNESNAAKPDSLPQINAELERLKPDIEAFKKRLEPIKTEFRDNLEAILTPEQREKLKMLSERVATAHASDTSHTSPDRPPRPWRSHDGLDSVFPIVIVANTLDRLTEELSLTEEQKTAVRDLLAKRRDKFLELVDKSPPPSLKLRRIAPLVNSTPAGK